MSFKYRFILSFVLLEVFFIILIVTMNFIAIRDSSDKLIKDKIESNISFLEELVKVPISIYDLATLDNLVESTKDLEYINSIVVLDAQNKILTKLFQYKHGTIDELLSSNENKNIVLDDETYEIRYKKINEDDINLGSLIIVFDTTENSMFISSNKNRTIFIVLIEIIISTILSFIIGSRLTNMLTNLSLVAEHIGEEKQIEIPYQEKSDEIGILSKSMQQMQYDLKTRSDRLKTLALELNKQKNELIEANKYKDDFLANMSHELKTPLNSINVISSVMMKNKKGKLEDDQVKNLSIINKCGNDLLYLINDVLDISKLEAGEVSLNLKTINIKELLIEIKDMFEPQTKNKGLNFVFDFPLSNEYIVSDDNRIKQIIKNLLSNSLKFVEEGSIKLIVKDLDKNIQIIVNDDGIGIPKEKLEHIFDRFKQVDGSTTRKFGGTGLGLAICKELAVLLNGDIIVESIENVSTTFTLTIPKNESDINLNSVKEIAKVSEPLAVKEETTDSFIDSSNDKKEKNVLEEILILNNDPISFMSIVTELKKTYKITQVNSFDKLEEKIKEVDFKNTIIDISNTNINDDDISSLKSSNTIIITNNLDVELSNKEEYLAILNKPIEKEKLLQKIKG